jgi:SAM-dependent methyltransferase
LIEEMGLGERVRLTGYTTELDFFRYLKAVDVIVNLRFPTAGETSGTLVRALGTGKPVIVSDHGQFGELPDQICLKVAPGPTEERELFSRLRTLAYRPTFREKMGQRAAEWIRREHEIEKSAARYLMLAEEIITERHHPRHAPPMFPLASEEREIEIPRIKLDHEAALDYVSGFFRDDPDAIGYLKTHGERIVRTVELIPVGGPDKRLLELSSYLQMTPLIKRYGEYGEIAITNWWEGEPRQKWQKVTHAETGEEVAFPMQNVDVERDRLPYPDGYFDVALCCELIEHLTEDPMQMMVELNRVLKWGGLLILTTPNIASAFSISEALAGSSPYIYGSYNRKSRADRHSREYTPKDVRLVFEAAGFKVMKLFTENLWHKTDEGLLDWLDRTGVPRELRGDNIFAVGRKSSLKIERYPERIYD